MARLVLLIFLLTVVGCRPQTDRHVIELGGETMGSTWSARMVVTGGTPDEAAIAEIEGEIGDVLRRIETLMSTWDPSSELSRFNESKSVSPYPISPDTAVVFRRALALSRETGGAFDVTVGALVDAWGFGPAADAPREPPDEARLAILREMTGARHLRLDPAGNWIQKLHPDVRCDLSGLAPGYAADRLAAILEQRGLHDFLVDVGGEMIARGRNVAGRPWQVAIERPPDDGAGGDGRSGDALAVATVVPLIDHAIATSGDYRNYREVNGERLAHIIDPRAGRPIQHRLASATVIDREAVRADALATALMVLGPEDGLALAERLDVAALLLVRREDGGFDHRPSARMRRLIEAGKAGA